MIYDDRHSLLIVGSCSKSMSLETSSSSDTITAAQHGITLWRILSGSPHYKLVTDCEMDAKLVSKEEGNYFISSMTVISDMFIGWPVN